ncbi:MAG: hypothetical protein KAH30_02565 [Caldisericia bacterium]|nr:hypothetical protein [Caldisericia bacterium]
MKASELKVLTASGFYEGMGSGEFAREINQVKREIREMIAISQMKGK